MQKEIIQVGPYPHLTVSTLVEKTQSYISGISKAPPWEMSKESLRRTLNYLVDYLHVPFYLLCVGTDGLPKLFYKVEPTTTAPVFLNAFREQKVKLPSKPFRVMQCILKTLSPQSESRFSDEYFDLFSRLDTLPPGVFVINLSDAVLIPRNNSFPFPIPGISLNQYYVNQLFLPVVSSSGSIQHFDNTIPTYDDLALDWSVMPTSVTVEDWMKKQDKAVFRGSPTGCGRKEDTNIRMLVSGWTQRDPAFAQHVNAGIVLPEKNAGSPVVTESLRVDPIHGLGTVKETELLTVGFMNQDEQNQYRYRLHIDGNVLAYRLTSSLLSDSLVLRIESPYRGWLDSVLKPGIHYVLVPNDANLHDALIERIEYYNQHPEEAVAIINAAHETLQKEMSGGVENTFRKLFANYVSKFKAAAHISKTAAQIHKTYKRVKKVAPTQCQPLVKTRRKRSLSLLHNNKSTSTKNINTTDLATTDLANAAIQSNRPIPSNLSTPFTNQNILKMNALPPTPVRIPTPTLRM